MTQKLKNLWMKRSFKALTMCMIAIAVGVGSAYAVITHNDVVKITQELIIDDGGNGRIELADEGVFIEAEGTDLYIDSGSGNIYIFANSTSIKGDTTSDQGVLRIDGSSTTTADGIIKFNGGIAGSASISSDDGDVIVTLGS